MISMTGYGHSIYRSDDYVVELEIKSYNNRFLDISHSINPLLSSYEMRIDEEIKKIAARGHLDVSMRLKVLKNDVKLTLDQSLLDGYKAVFSEIESRTGVKASFSDYASIDGLVSSERCTDSSAYSDGVEYVLNEAMNALEESKKRDGNGTYEDLVRLGHGFEAALLEIDSRSSELEEYFKKVLLEKYQELLGEKGNDDPRFLAEVAALLVKYSINEECSRLKVHIAEYKRLLELNEPVGKRLDFLCQEMNRECNTIASKSQLVEINLLVVKMKDNLENIREQIRNIE